MTTSIPLRVCQTRSEHLEPQKRGKTKMLERRVRTAKYLVFRTRENPWKQRETGGRKSLSCGGFRVLHLRPLGQLSVSIFVRFSFQKFAQNFVGEKTGETAKNIRFWDFLCWGISRRIRGMKFPASAEISSQGRYDHFDTYPWMRFTNARMIITNPAKKIKYGGGISANSVV